MALKTMLVPKHSYHCFKNILVLLNHSNKLIKCIFKETVSEQQIIYLDAYADLSLLSINLLRKCYLK